MDEPTPASSPPGFGFGPRRNQAAPGNHRHIVGSTLDGYISETLFDPETDIVSGYASGGLIKLLKILEGYGLTVDVEQLTGSGYWKWNDALSGDPGIAYIGGNAALMQNNTEIRVSKTDNDGKTVTGLGLESGDLITVAGLAASGFYEVVAVQQFETWFAIEVNYANRGVGNIPQDELVVGAFYPGGAGHTHPDYLEPSEVLAGDDIRVDIAGDTVVITNTAPGIEDHGLLTGLSDDDHPQYAKVDHSHPVDAAALWTYRNTHTMTDPGNGSFHTNNVSLTLTSRLAVSVEDHGGTDVTKVLVQLQVDDLITVQDQDNSTNFVRYKVTALPTNHLTWFEIPVVEEAVGSPDSLTNNQLCAIDFHFNAGGGGGGTGTEETFYQPTPPVNPAVADVWMDSDGISAYPETHPVPTGAVFFFASGTLPNGYIICDGRAVSRTTYPALFVVCGTTFGSGDGATTFNVPNLIGKYTKGSATGGGTGGGTSHIHPGTNWRTGFTNIGSTNNTDSAPSGTGNANGAPDGTGTAGNHTHGGGSTGSTSIGHSHGIGSDGGHNHGGTGTQSGTYGSAGGGTGVTKTHSHSISSGGSHNHGGTGSAGGSHNHPIGTTGSHEHTVPNSMHSHGVAGSNHNHGIAGSNHDHSVPNSTDQNHEPPYLTLVPMIYTGI